MKKLITFCFIFFTMLSIVYSESEEKNNSSDKQGYTNCYIGFMGNIELNANPFVYPATMQTAAFDNLSYGVYLDARKKNWSLGLDNLIKFKNVQANDPQYRYDWYFDWLSSVDLKYHFFEQESIDPFLETGIGCAGSVALPKEEDGSSPLQNLSLFGKIGGGLAFQLKPISLGIQMDYIYFNTIPPATQLTPYPLKRIFISLFIGTKIKP